MTVLGDGLNELPNALAQPAILFGVPILVAIDDPLHLLRAKRAALPGLDPLFLQDSAYLHQPRRLPVQLVDKLDYRLLLRIFLKAVAISLVAIWHGPDHRALVLFILHRLLRTMFDLSALHFTQERFHGEVEEPIRSAGVHLALHCVEVWNV